MENCFFHIFKPLGHLGRLGPLGPFLIDKTAVLCYVMGG